MPEPAITSSAIPVGGVSSPRPDELAPEAATRTRASAPCRAGRLAAGTRFAALPAKAAGGLVWLYQKTLSPALAAANPLGGCRFAPTCSHYARQALREHGFFAGLVLTFVRLAKCGPWHPGGVDPVPPRRKPVCVAVGRTPARP